MSSFDSERSTNDENENVFILSNNVIINSISLVLLQVIEESKQNQNYYKELHFQLKNKNIFTARDIPKITITDYLERILYYTKIENNTLISSLIYIDRLLLKSKMQLNEFNIHRILFTSILISLKYNEDMLYKMKYYATVAGISLNELIRLESEFINLIQYELYITNKKFEIYKKYLTNIEENLALI